MALVSGLKGQFSVSLRRVQRLLKNVFGLELSLGYINATMKSVSKVMRPLFLEILDHIDKELILNVDETSFRIKGKRVYTWTFSGQNIVAFKIATRSKYILEVVLGKFKGTIGCDFYAAYQSFIKDKDDIVLQFCMAHLVRDFKYCYDFNKSDAREYGKKALDILRQIFHNFHLYKDLEDRSSERGQELYSILCDLKEQLIKAAIGAPSSCRKAKAIAARFENPVTRDYYFTFIDNPDVSPTNNAAELAIRNIVVDRKICYGVQSQDGVLFCETFWTICKNLELRNVSVHSFITDVLKANKDGLPLPSAINIGSTVDPKYIEQAKEEEEEFRAEMERILAQKKASKAKDSTASKKKSKAKAVGSKKTSTPSYDEKNEPKGREKPHSACEKPSETIPTPSPNPMTPEARPRPSSEANQPQEPSPKPPGLRTIPTPSPKTMAPEAKQSQEPRPKSPGSSEPEQNIKTPPKEMARHLNERDRQSLMDLVKGATRLSGHMTPIHPCAPPPITPVERRTPTRL
jgi:hypothetical protein